MRFKEGHVALDIATKPVMGALAGTTQKGPPAWLMRQAGRYLPEYRKIRSGVETFLDLCFTPRLAAEVTLQPVRRFGFDAAILFSDILVVPHALGQAVSFESGEGPRLDPVADGDAVGRLQDFDAGALAPVYETIDRVKHELPVNVAFLGFCGAPWTVATYMVAGRGGEEQHAARLFAYRDPAGFGRLIDVLSTASAAYLVRQLKAGVDAVQIFDTWAGVLPPDQFKRWCVEPVQRIITEVRSRVPDAPVIWFPRGAGSLAAHHLPDMTINALGLDWAIDKAFAREHIQSRVTVQGNLDPLALLAGGASLDGAVDAVLEAFAERPFIFNLGHGILPQTPVEHVERMLARVRAYGISS
jgi:uroporphyrinogen decarboxylase